MVITNVYVSPHGYCKFIELQTLEDDGFEFRGFELHLSSHGFFVFDAARCELQKNPVRKSNPTAALPSFAWLAWLPKHRSTRLRMSNVGDGSTRHGDMKAKGGEGGAEPFSRQNSW